jgi:predicted CoA-binding protein
MHAIDNLQELSEIGRLLRQSRTIAIVGLSPKESRPSNMVGRYLLDAGYTIFPVNPGQETLLGRQCYPDLSALPEQVDIVDIFRKSEDIPEVVEQILALPQLPRAIWMQQGIVHEEAANRARNRGVMVIMDRCIKIDHRNLLGA